MNLSFVLLMLVPAVAGAQQIFREWVSELQGEHGRVGLVVYDLDEGKEVYSHRRNEFFEPASTIKWPTAVMALEELGEDFTLYTHVLRQKLKNDQRFIFLTLISVCDPSLDSKYNKTISVRDYFADMAYDVFSDRKYFLGLIEDWFQDIPQHPDVAFEDVGNYYAPGIYSFNYGDNFEWVSLIQNDSTGIEVKVRGSEFESRVKTGLPGSGDKAYVIGSPGSGKRKIIGTIPPGNGNFTIKASHDDPKQKFLASLYAFHDEDANYWWHGMGFRKPPNPDSTINDTIFSIPSLPLGQWMYPILHKSDNLYSDATFFHATGERTWNGAAEAMTKWLSNYMGSPWQGIIKDGSGLANGAAITPWQMALFISKTHRISPQHFKHLPSRQVGNSTIRYKTGSKEHVSNVVGVLEKNNKRYAFALYTHHVDRGSGAIRRDFFKLMDQLF